MLKSIGLAAGVITVAALAGPATAFAVPLDAAACTGLNQERNTLETSGVLTDLRLPATEAKALAKDRVMRAQRYVEVAGQLLFRCSVAGKPDVAPGSATAQDAAETTGSSEPPPAAKPKGTSRKIKK